MNKTAGGDDLKIKVEKVLGHSDSEYASGAFTKRISLGDEEFGTLVSCMLVKGGNDPGGQILHELFELFTKKFEGAEGGVLARLKIARDAVGLHIEEIGIGGGFTSALFYKSAGFIVRYKDWVRTFVYKAPDSAELKFESGSGHADVGQLFVFGTEKFYSTFDAGVFSREENIDFEEMIDGLATDISAEADQSQIGAVFVSILGDLPKVEEKKGLEDEDKKEDELSREQKEETEVEPVHEPLVGEGGGVAASGVGKTSSGNPVSTIAGFIKGLFLKILGLNYVSLFARKNIPVLVLIIVLVLVGSGYWTIKSKEDGQKLADFQTHMATANSKFSEGSSILGLNRDRGRNSLVEAQNEVRAALFIKPKDSAALALAESINQKLKESEAQASVDFKTFFEADGNVGGLTTDGGNFVVFGENFVISVDKTGKKVGDFGDVSDVIGGTTYNKSAFVLTGNGASRLDSNKSKHEVESGESGQDIGVFLGNVYLLANNQIHKYVPVEGGYSKSADYLENPQSFPSDSRFTIDGSIWVTAGADIFKYTRGKREDFSLSGLVSGGGNYGEVYTNADIDNLYVIDRTNSALLVFNKDGVYQNAYQAKEFSGARDLFVDEAGGKMYIASGNKVLVAGL